MNNNTNESAVQGLTLILGGTGKTGRRIAERLEAKGTAIRIGSRAAAPSFDWNRPSGWDACLQGVESVYLNYAPDLAVPGATDSISDFVARAKQSGVKRLVLLSGRGEEEAQACEKIVQGSGLAWTIVRASWFSQNFSEGAFLDMVLAGQLTLPVGAVKEPFVDVDDVAEVAAVALTEAGHDGQVYEVTGPRLMTFAQAAAEISNAIQRPVSFVEIPHASFIDGMKKSGAPAEVVWLIDYLFTTVLDGRNDYLTDGVQRALGREPRDFADYARDVAASGRWRLVS